MVTHENLLANIEMIRANFGWHDRTVMMSWLPLFHDMGLIGNTLTPVYVGFECIQMPPAAFLQHPGKWLLAASRYRATCIGAPDFAYDLCSRRTRPDELDRLDLSTLEWAYSGAEPVRLETIEEFTSVFSPYGFRKKAWYPCYGLAEATLFVSGGTKDALPVVCTLSSSGLERHQVITTSQEGDARQLVGSGTVKPEEVIIVNPMTTTPCTEAEVGEIWVSGPHIAEGYWNNKEATERTFKATISGSENGPFLRTGDLGFVKDGELFITGRIKDLIILRGRNYYPQDIELAAWQVMVACVEGGLLRLP
jgi:acyl-CoA synthetase (AMP-forming)/AMP-acid ligase II